MAIYSCKGCENRYPGCHSKCADYLMQKAEHDAMKEEYNRKREIEIGIYSQRSLRVDRALRHRRKGAKYDQ